MRVRVLLLLSVLAVDARFARAQTGENPAPGPSATPEATATPGEAEVPVASLDDAPRVFLDCDWCDSSYIRKEVGFVAYVRDRALADVHVIVSFRTTGAGGFEYTLRFIGLDRFDGVKNALTAVLPPIATDDETRVELVRVLRIGLAPYAARTGVSKQLEVSWTPSATPAAKAEDPWDHWVMRMSGSGRFEGESSIRHSFVSGSANAARITELLKLRLNAYGNFYESRFDFGDGEVVETFRRDTGTSVFGARGFGEHLSAGMRVSWSSSTFTNRRSHTYAQPTLEWSLFPYEESTRRYLVLQYSPSASYTEYYEQTIFDKDWEILFSESLDAVLGLTEPWGSVTVSLSGSHYFHDETKAAAFAGASLDLRLVKGLSLTFFGNLSLLRDQLYLPKAGATEAEILLQRKQIATSYSYYGSVGLTYTFGSIYTPVVNTRLEPGS